MLTWDLGIFCLHTKYEVIYQPTKTYSIIHQRPREEVDLFVYSIQANFIRLHFFFFFNFRRQQHPTE